MASSSSEGRVRSLDFLKVYSEESDKDATTTSDVFVSPSLALTETLFAAAAATATVPCWFFQIEITATQHNTADPSDNPAQLLGPSLPGLGDFVS